MITSPPSSPPLQAAPADWWAVTELLREENASLRKQVDHYYSKAKKLQKVSSTGMGPSARY